MRLHNRQIKASFWNDPDLIDWPRDKRMFYLGLVQLADDSGCLENRPRAFKANVFPSDLDADITSSLLADWVQELAEQKKIIAYTTYNKDCLYLVNFHKHQRLKTPSPPEVPLPEWVRWEPFDSNPRTGKYIIDELYLTEFLQKPYTLLTKFFQPEEEPEIEPEVEPEDNSAIAPPPSDSVSREEKPEPPKQDSLAPETPGQKLFCLKFKRKRFATMDQKLAIANIERDLGFDILERALVWAAENNINKISSIRTTAFKMAKGPPRGNGSDYSANKQEEANRGPTTNKSSPEESYLDEKYAAYTQT